jgi:peptidoglycan/xylan/chitin deacetylase (PgdA/CDA1 family)
MGALAGVKRLPLVIGYHRVVEDAGRSSENSIPAMLISCRMLERHLDWIGRRFRFLTLDELGSRLEGGGPFDEPAVAITFDDGYRDVYDNAFPLLRRKGIPAAFFAVTDLIGTSGVPIHDKLHLLLARAFSSWVCPQRHLESLLLDQGIQLSEMQWMRKGHAPPAAATHFLHRALSQAEIQRLIEAIQTEVGIDESVLAGFTSLTWDMLAEMHRAGMTIGSHTRTHTWLTNEHHERVFTELAGSRRELERKLGIEVKHFAYPNGRFTSETVRSVAASGYRFGYTTCGHRDPRYPLLTIPRRLLWENSCLDGFGRFSSAIMSWQLHGIVGVGACSKRDHQV